MKYSGLGVLPLLFVAVLYKVDGSSDKLMVCYYVATPYFPPSKVPADICTHVLLAGSGIVTPSGIQAHSPGDIQVYRELVALKQKNPRLKVLLSLASGFSSVVDEGEGAMINFSRAAVQNLTTYGLDGVDLDWEFPILFQKTIFKKFIGIFGPDLKKSNLLLSIALPTIPLIYVVGYDTQTLAEHMDFMTAMTYDFHQYLALDKVTGYNSPLYTPKGEGEFSSTAAVLEFYLESGLPANKLLMGVPLYGRSWELANASSHGLHAPAINQGAPGPYGNSTGMYYYPDSCLAEQHGANLMFDKVDGAAYLYMNSTWVAYDNPETVEVKMSWLKSHNLSGVGIWAMHLDDLTGLCKAGSLPLLNAIKSNL